YQDALAMYSDFRPKFVKKFAEVGSVMKQGFADYIKEVKGGTFPAEEHCFKIEESVMNELMIKKGGSI
ncbi:MAG: 3-methyl-2-oxobutanoate hydroxymethyltransferase, partial [Oscillospiraceae bacterium]|nr:3-methyl-2-oxobutanoate hydroxymethyltransferase [Oscillospiraceae bacterium]